MAHKQERRSTSHVIRELQIKTKWYHYISIKLIKIQNSVTSNPGKKVEQWEVSFINIENAEMVEPPWKSVGSVFFLFVLFCFLFFVFYFYFF